jgi:eukaryotic-like serine/threonine-protein kinase
MVYRMPQDDGLGQNADDGDVVGDDELLTSQPDASPRFESRTSFPRLSQRVRRSLGPGLDTANVLVGRYQVERVVARTAHEVIVQAIHLELAQRVLVRYLTPEASASPEAVARFQRGARKAREMRSEHAERVVDFGRMESGSPYRAAELPNGPSLAEILRVRGPLPIAEAVDIVLTACEPVAEAHASGVVHRSLSTSNIFVERRPDGSPLVRVLDFGVSDALEPEWATGEDYTRSGAVMMTESLPYAAPEQIRNPAGVDARADVWALGAIVYELLAGEQVFQAETAVQLLAVIAADTPTPLNMLRGDVPRELESVVLACLEKDAETRPRSVVDLVLALSPFGSPEAQSAAARVTRIVARTTRPPPLPSGLPLPSQHHRVSRPSALVHSRPASRIFETPVAVSGDSRGIGLLIAGGAIGVVAAVVTALLTRPVAPAAAAPEPPHQAPLAPAPIAPAQVAPAQVAPAQVGTTAPAVLAAAAPQPAPQAVAPAPAAAPVAASPRPVAASPRVAAPRAASESPRPAARSERPAPAAAEQKPTVTADAKDLFSGLE